MVVRVAREGFGWTARFAVRIASAVDLSRLAGYAELSTEDRYARARTEDAGYLARLCDARCACLLSWSGSGVTLSGCLRGPDERSARDAGEAALDVLLSTPDHVVARPCEDDGLPFAPRGVAELRRRCRVVEARRPDAGARYYLALPPLRSSPRTWGGLLDRLPDDVAVVVALRPTRVRPEFTAVLDDIADRYAVLAAPGVFSSGGLYARRREVPGEPFAGDAARLYREAAARYRGRAFRMRVAVVSAGPLERGWADAAADAVGGVAEFPSPAEHAAALRGLTAAEPVGWGAHPAVPPSLAPLRELADPAEAAQAAWLPAAGAPMRFPVSAPPRVTGGGVTIVDSTVTVEGDLFGGAKHA